MVSCGKIFRLRKTLFRSYSSVIDISDEIQAAIKSNRPVVALESTIITHGMPHPHNLKTALQVEEIIREQGVVPATIGVIDGRVKVGLNKSELIKLADPLIKKYKTSRRDFPYIISNGLCGGTTVSGTILIAKTVGIHLFVTGGIGGVHKNGENTLDISADLKELGMNSIMTVCSGVKSILDIAKTLEYLETEGVCVARYGCGSSFPAFYSRESMYPAPYLVKTPLEAARLLQAMLELKMNSGIILAVPVPQEFSIDYEAMEANISLALGKAKEEGKSGKDITPFVLNEIANITHGQSLEANIALIKNNALIGAKVAKEHNNLILGSAPTSIYFSANTETKRPVVVGGSNVDTIVRLTTELKMDGRTLSGSVSQAGGGVGRNIADCLSKIYCSPLFISAVGEDQMANFLLSTLKNNVADGVKIQAGQRTASYTTFIDSNGETRFGVGDMAIHTTIGTDLVEKNKSAICNSSLLVMDGNIPTDTLIALINMAATHRILAWFEPTDISKASKPFATPLWKNLSFISPNLMELREMSRSIGVEMAEEFNTSNNEKLLEQVEYLALPLAEEIPMVMVTLGRNGLMMLTSCREGEPLMSCLDKRKCGVHTTYYPPLHIPEVENTSGAGDCTAAGFVTGVLAGWPEAACVHTGLEAGRAALLSTKPVPDDFCIPPLLWT